MVEGQIFSKQIYSIKYEDLLTKSQILSFNPSKTNLKSMICLFFCLFLISKCLLVNYLTFDTNKHWSLDFVFTFIKVNVISRKIPKLSPSKRFSH